MTLLKNPLQVVRFALQTAMQLADKLLLSGIRKRFSRKNFLKIEWIKLKDLKIDSKYQRLINRKFIENAKEFRPTLVKPLSVFLRPDGDYAVVDGQHTCVIAATYVEDPSEFELPCQVQEHPSEFTLEECLEAEAKYFSDFNSTRTNMSSVALLRADLAQGKKYAVRIDENFKKLEVHVELIGAEDDGENSVKGYRGLKDAISKYGLTYTGRAIQFYKRQNSQSKFKGWKRLDGSMILGLTALFHLLDNVKGIDQKATDLTNYMVEHLCKKSVNEITHKTAGMLQDILIVERVLDWYNTAADVCSYVKIGTEKDNSILSQWKDDPIHKKKCKESDIDD